MYTHTIRRVSIIKTFVAFAFLACAVSAINVTATHAHAGSVIGLSAVPASIAPNPFDTDLDGNPEITTDIQPVGFGNPTAALPLDNLVNRRDSRSGIGASRVQGIISAPVFTFPPLPARVEYSVTADAGPFSVGTIITAQYLRNYAEPSPFELSLLTPSGPTPSTSVQSGPGLPNTHPIQLTTLSAPIDNVTGFSITQTIVTFPGQSGNEFGDFNEVLLLADTYTPVNITNVTGSTANTGLTFGSLAGVADAKGGLDGQLEDLTDAFYIADPTPDRFVQLEFADDQPVDGIVIANLVNAPADIRIFDDTDTPIADVSLDAEFPAPGQPGTGGGEFLPILFDTPLTTSHLRLEFLGSDPIGLREVIVLRQQAIPEPGTLALILFGVFFVARRPA